MLFPYWFQVVAELTKEIISSKHIFNGYNNAQLHGRLFRPDDNSAYPGIIFFHGYNTNSIEFSDFPQLLAQNGNVVFVFDYSGHGKSTGTRNLFTYESHFTDSIQAVIFLSKQNVKNITVLGHSLGAHAAFRLLKKSEIVHNGIILSPQIKSGDSLRPSKKVLSLFTGLLYLYMSRLIKDIYIRINIDYQKNYEDHTAVQRAIRAGFISDRVNARFTAYALKINNIKVARDIDKPILFVVSDKDRSVKPENSIKVFDAIGSKRKKLVRLPDSGHSPFDDYNKMILLEEIDTFIKNEIK